MEIVKKLSKEHPWLTGFRQKPDTALDELLRGIAFISPYERAESADVLVTFFSALNDGDPLLKSLDQTLTKWLKKRRQDGPAVRHAYGVDRYLEELIQALSAVYRLLLPLTADYLRENLTYYQGWLVPLNKGPGQDPASELWRVMALIQPDRRFLKDWYHLCAEADHTLPINYQSLGLLGLRMMPEENGEQIGRLKTELLAGLFRWASRLQDNKPNQRVFIRQIRMIKVLYPRTLKIWRERLAPLIQQYKGTGAAFLPWLEKAGIKNIKTGRIKGAVSLPAYARRGNLLKRLKQKKFQDILPDIRKLITEHERYAEATGDAGYLVKTACDFSRLLLKKEPSYALELARTANRWQPSNYFSWSLLARALEKLYKDELAEIVYWEAMRRFPENVYFRNQLSGLLVRPRVGRHEVAEKLLWETMDRFPNDEVCRNALAELLAKSGREKDAEDILWETMVRFPNDKVCRVALAELLAKSGREKDAEDIFRKTMDRFPNDEVCRNALAELLAKSGREKDAEDIFRKTMDRFPNDGVCRVAYCFWLLRWRRTSKEASTFYDKEIVSLPESPRKAKLRELLEKGKVYDVSEIEVPDLWDLMDEINVLDVPEHMQVKEPELGDDVSVPETPKPQPTEEIDVNQEYLPLRENMLVSRADLFLRTSDDEKEQEDELAKLNVILENDPEKIFARLVISLYDENSRQKIADEVDAYYHAYPLRFLAAREIDDKRQWDELLHDFPEHRYLTSLGRLDSEAVDDIGNEAVKLRKWSATHNGNGDFEEFAKRKVHDWLFQNMGEAVDMDILAGNLNKNRDKVEIFLKDGLKRAVDENVCYSI
ncbi:MAG: tetratricopeptide repeat protein [Deltaproteobacteria bacterium]|jgi:predicted Zn-dependent protease|nr:tetratricopeptide repeat protein [Deltaproteobacteria bacterium]